jgi:hypothetical protein
MCVLSVYCGLRNRLSTAPLDGFESRHPLQLGLDGSGLVWSGLWRAIHGPLRYFATRTGTTGAPSVDEWQRGVVHGYRRNPIAYSKT